MCLPHGSGGAKFPESAEGQDDQWVLVDTEAGVEHFGRGVLEGVETVLMVVHPSHESVMLADKASRDIFILAYPIIPHNI